MKLFQCITGKITMSATKKPELTDYWFEMLLFRAVLTK